MATIPYPDEAGGMAEGPLSEGMSNLSDMTKQMLATVLRFTQWAMTKAFPQTSGPTPGPVQAQKVIQVVNQATKPQDTGTTIAALLDQVIAEKRQQVAEDLAKQSKPVTARAATPELRQNSDLDAALGLTPAPGEKAATTETERQTREREKLQAEQYRAAASAMAKYEKEEQGAEDAKGKMHQEQYRAAASAMAKYAREEKKEQDEARKRQKQISEEHIAGIKKAAGAMMAAGAATTGFVAMTVHAASPVAWNTLTESFELLSASIGRAFIPMVAEASKWLQDMANWVQHLDRAALEQIGTAAKWVIGIGLFVTVGMRARSMLVGMQSALVDIGFSKATARLALLTGGVLAFALAWGQAKEAMDAAELSQRKFHAQEGARRAKAGESPQSADIEGLTGEQRRQLAEAQKTGKEKETAARLAGEQQQVAGGITEEKIQKALDDLRKLESGKVTFRYLGKRAEVLRGIGLEEPQIPMAGEIPGSAHLNRQNPGLSVRLGGPELTEEQIQNFGAMARKSLEDATNRADILKGVAKHGLPAAGKDAGNTHLLAADRSIAPQFSGLEEARKRIQIASLNLDPIQQKILNQQRENNRAMVVEMLNNVREGKAIPVKEEKPQPPLVTP